MYKADQPVTFLILVNISIFGILSISHHALWSPRFCLGKVQGSIFVNMLNFHINFENTPLPENVNSFETR